MKKARGKAQEQELGTVLSLPQVAYMLTSSSPCCSSKYGLQLLAMIQ
jgi:hypothetical protein